MSNSKEKKTRIIVLIILGFITLFSDVCIFIYKELTFLNIAMVVLPSLLFAVSFAILSQPFWRFLTAKENRGLNIGIATFFFTSLFAASFYVLNYACSDKQTRVSEQVAVVEKYSKTRYHSKRVSRNRYTRGEAYNVYFFKIEFANGTVKEYETVVNKYRNTDVGDSIQVSVEKGLFGPEVIKRKGPKPHRAKNRY